MQLWLKCPVCQAKNPLTIKACSSCGASLENLPPAKRVYILETAGARASLAPRPVPAVPQKEVAPPSPEGVAATPKKAKVGPKQPKKKKRQD
jgi:hypothetical protein